MTDFSSLVCEADLIAGDWVQARTGRTIDVTDPATGGVIARVPDGGADEARAAIDAAYAAFPAYAAMPLGERVALMRRLHQAILDEQEALAARSPPSRASRSPSRASRSPPRPPMSSGSPRRRAAPMAGSSPRRSPGGG
jgi:hypothetical protein